jgi:hypothetical protein
VYDFTVSATDAAGNASTNTVALTMKDGPDSTIAVFYDAAHTQSAGNLIKPVTVDSGKLFYYWDVSGDGTKGGDYATHDVLDGIFNKDVNGNMNPAGSTADTTDTYRYGTLYKADGTAVNVALPTRGDGRTNTGYMNGTSVGNSTASLGSNATNSTYDDLLAIWDAYNGTGTNSALGGVPTGWASDSYYWSATRTSAGNHAYVHLNVGTVGTYTDTVSLYVALQVL